MELAVILGIGPAALTGLTGLQRLMDPATIVHLAARDQQEAAECGAPDPAIDAAEMLQVSFDSVISQGAATAGAAAASRLGQLTGFWVHLDLDVLSTAAFPAVDYPQPGGLDWGQLRDLVRPLTTAPGFRGMNVTILNPDQGPWRQVRPAGRSAAGRRPGLTPGSPPPCSVLPHRKGRPASLLAILMGRDHGAKRKIKGN